MTTDPIEQVAFRSAIAAVNSTDHLRVYFQDVYGNIRESVFESGWNDGTLRNVIAQSKISSPLAATSKDLEEIRVYYISTDNELREMAYSNGSGWSDGDLNNSNFVVAPYSKIAATFLAVGGSLQLRIYVQLVDNSIQEYGYDNGNTGWKKMTNLGAGLPGTEIATTSYKTSQLSIRTYFQDPRLTVIEKAYDANRGWYAGGLSIPNAVPRTALAVISFAATATSISLRLYYGASNNKVLEKGWDSSSWYDGGFNQPSIPGSEIAGITWGSGGNLNLRIYFQNGTKTTGISEWVWNRGWTRGVAAIPPA